MLKRLGYFASALQALSSVMLLGASTLLISTAATHVPIMMLMSIVVLVRAFAIGRAAFRYTERMLLHDSAFRMLEKVRVKVFERLEPVAPIGLRGMDRGDLVARVVEDVDELQTLQLRVLPGLLQSLVATTLAVGLVSIVSIETAAYLLILMVGTFAIAFVFSYFAGARKQILVAKQRAKIYETLIDLGDRAEILVAFEWQTDIQSVVEEQSSALARLERRNSFASGIAGSILLLGLFASQGVAAWLGSELVLSGRVERIYLASFVLLPLAVFELYQLALPAVGAYKRYRGSKSRVDEILKIESKPFGGTTQLNGFERLSFESVELSYQAEKKFSVPDFEISAGETLAVVGRSGSGKSSLANVLVGFMPHVSGEILINGDDLRTISHESLRQVIGLVEQSSNILLGTVADNLRLAKPDASDQELVAVLERVGLWKTLVLREGLNTNLGESGKWLSGGEASRVALARLVLSKRELLILDEPTAALDRELGHRLVSEMIAIAKLENRAVILITHDRELVRYCDREVSF